LHKKWQPFQAHKAGSKNSVNCRTESGDAGRFRTFAMELIALAPDIIMAGGSPAVAALQHAVAS
jgi:hypothetical protein